MISNEKTYLFLLAFMIFSSASLYAIDDDEFSTRTPTIAAETVEAIENKSIVLSCGRTKMPDSDVKWFFNGILIVNQSQQRKHQIAGDLHINAVQRNDSGRYTCAKINNNKQSQQVEIQKDIQLEIIWLRSAEIVHNLLISSSSTATPKSLTTIILKCRVDGNRLDEIRWYKDDKPLKSIGLLMIHHPTQTNSGTYKCRAHSAIGMVESEPYRIEIHTNDRNSIHSSSEIFCEPIVNHTNEMKERSLVCRYKHNGSRLHRKRSTTEGGSQSSSSSSSLPASKRRKLAIAEDSSATIHCDVSHLDRKASQISVRWKKDNKLIRQSMLNAPNNDISNGSPFENPHFRDDGRITMDSKNGSITIAATIPSDSGLYECSIHRNGNGVLSVQSTDLTVIEKLKFAPPPTSKGLEIGKVGKIHCKVQGTPTPLVSWKLVSSDNLPDSVEDVNGTLIFKNVSESDRGQYSCHASNDQGEISATVVVTPVIAPKFLVKPQGPIQVNEMGSVMIHCAATGLPMPHIQWDKNFNYIDLLNNSDASRLNVLDNGTLYFTEVHLEDEGLYGCTIGSSAGLKREEAHLTVRPAEEILNDDAEGSFFVVRAVLITVTVVFSYIILVIGLMLWCRVKRKARKNRMQLIAKENVESSRNDTKPNEPNDENEPCLAEKNHKKVEKNWNGTSNGVSHPNTTTANETQKNEINSKYTSKSGLDVITIPRTILYDISQLGRGEFGAIFAAKVKFGDLKQHLHKDTATALTIENEREQRKSNGSLENVNEIKEASETATADETVNYALIKALNKVKDEHICIEFRRQLDMFRAISHRNVVRLFGLCRDKDPHYLVLEHTDLGDLKEFLLARVDQMANISSINGITQKPLNGNQTSAAAAQQPAQKCPPLKCQHLLSFAQQIARGMDAIYRARYIHRDLACRNCVITSDLTVKVSYPANIKDKYAREYFKLKGQLVPLRWMAPEYIADDDNTIKSDVYSFGVLVLELFAFCSELPLEHVSDDDYLQQLQENKIERKMPTSIPDEITKSLLLCWKTHPKERPSFSTLNSVISKHLQQTETTP